ncbi:hypothetical protein J1N35_038106 [Gossypium stocksii]|uniref:Uncharacterized protein n=1 Tax=Gossypium stocksii TaxID=47602 RepID=A0A9D3UL92_9ROSI|nr:hypothetical protein J1N35_038106 [Gossypium stocksii]
MELVNDKDVEIMIVLYCGNRSDQNASIQLFAQLAGVEPIEDLTALGEEHGAQELCMVGPISNDICDHNVDSDSDHDVNEVPDDIDDKDVNDDGNINASSVRNQIRCIVMHNNPGAHMSLTDPNTAHIAEFPEYPQILPVHRLAVDSDPKELFIGQRFKSKEESVLDSKRYSMNISVDYKVAMSKLTLYIREC